MWVSPASWVFFFFFFFFTYLTLLWSFKHPFLDPNYCFENIFFLLHCFWIPKTCRFTKYSVSDTALSH
ncbi:hypothetical protein PVK06_010479 [Gossypium arboreum]|uniref:Uncharacterized protein n=1 Tax=Gossypium arboreum TaxID=29729 RepID=A0ABR0Q7D0_GOSAR|nr:hypothetical protein PVK06_010479 [Gossypium arboreum]